MLLLKALDMGKCLEVKITHIINNYVHMTGFLSKSFMFSIFIFLVICFFHFRSKFKLNSRKKQIELAVAKGHIQPFIQPIVCSESGRVVGGEILLRWRHPKLGVILPEKFITVAEQTGMMRRIASNCFTDVAKVLKSYINSVDGSYFICFNISAGQLENKELVILCKNFTKTIPQDKFRLVLEITEKHPVSKNQTTLKVINDLKKLGIQFSLDDFGTGNSNYHYLHLFEPDYIKIDKSFTSGCGEEQLSTIIVNSIVELAKHTECHIIAEGVETEEQKKLLCSKGAMYMQGYLFSHPVDLFDFLNILTKS
ncbi:EAL domain-containing protein [Enterobacter hormaechei]